MISEESAANFVENVLKFKNWREVLKRDKVEFVRIVTASYGHHTFFQNISMAAVPPGERQAPNVEKLVSSGLRGLGGVCVIQNTFLYILLKALGLNAYLVGSFVHGPSPRDDGHPICIIEITPEEKYLVDLGIGLPCSEPVPLHKLPYTKMAAGVRYGFKRSDEDSDLYVRVQMDGELFGGFYEDRNFEYVRCDWKMDPKPINHFVELEGLDRVFTEIEGSVFLRKPFLFRYFEEDDNGNILDEVNVNGNRKWILIRGVSVVIATDNEKAVTPYSSYDEVKPLVLKYFPKIPVEEVEKAFCHFNATVPKFGYWCAAAHRKS